MAAKMNAVQERKRLLLARSEDYRQSLDADLRGVKTAAAWVPKSVKVVRAIYPVLLLAAPLLGYVFSRKRPAPVLKRGAGKGILASALAGYKMFRQVRPILEH